MKLKIAAALALGLTALTPTMGVIADDDPIAARQAAMKAMGAALRGGDTATVCRRAKAHTIIQIGNAGRLAAFFMSNWRAYLPLA